ncbi:hypothetical protein SteCoe_2668 [Stentor coeruleus]|uniref:non-specific serine/threonine protein kinase n=1 Tax=Stentor coeruleus TaxID=5963 RepID=A0A1R2CYU7_9CILI|nr:hypothetical protein SteCoe_2668 [Stentor coeruleus]
MGCSPSDSSSNVIVSSKTSASDKANKAESLKLNAGSFIQQHKTNIYKHYNFDQRLGHGSYGIVRSALSKLNSVKRAIKSIKKSVLSSSPSSKTKLLDEVEVLKNLDHPNIVKLFEVYDDDDYYHLVTEFVQGGELLDYVMKRKYLSESDAKCFMKQILSGVAYCHSNNIVHRDLKLNNILLDKDSPDALIKIIDFGTSKIFKPKSKMTEKYGTPLYVAPEVLNGSYTEKCDIWSCGVIMYIILSGKAPFTGPNENFILLNIVKGRISYDGPEWNTVSDLAKDLLRKMLIRNPDVRISASQALEHAWFHKDACHNSISEEVQKNIWKNLSSFQAEYKLQHIVLTFIASNFLSKEEAQKSIEFFKSVDKNNDGKLSREELLEAYKAKLGPKEAEIEVDKILKKADINSSGFIDYTEFLAASIKPEELISDKYLEIAFKAFDTDSSGKINAQELREVLGNGHHCKDKMWIKLITEADINGDGEIDYNEFKEVMMRVGSPKTCK